MYPLFLESLLLCPFNFIKVPVFYNCKKSEEGFHFSDKKVKSEKGIQHWFCWSQRRGKAPQTTTVKPPSSFPGIYTQAAIALNSKHLCFISTYFVNPFSRMCPKGWRRKWHHTPLLLPGKSHGQRSLVGCSPWGC